MAIPVLRRYQRGDRLHVQAQQIWQILTAFVSSPTRKPSDPKTLPYGELALLMGYGTRQAGHNLGRQLGIVGKYCLFNHLPCLNVAVVGQRTDEPGDGKC